MLTIEKAILSSVGPVGISNVRWESATNIYALMGKSTKISNDIYAELEGSERQRWTGAPVSKS